MATQQQLRDAIEAARARGWYPINPTTLGAPSNRIERPTPAGTPDHWWPSPTYTTYRAISFVVVSRGRIAAVITRESPCPWVEGRDIKVSIKAAIEFLESE